MNKKSLLGHLIAVAVIVCGLIPRTALGGTNVPPHGSETTKPGPSARPGVANAQGVEVEFDSTRGQVTVRVSPRNLDGVTIPFPLRERLTVLENGVRQPGVSVVVEHSPITLGVLIEHGGRSHQLNDWVSTDASMLLRPLLDALDSQDRLGVFAYGDEVRTVVDFETSHDQWSLALGRLPEPRFSEANFYDATVTVLDRLATILGRKALLILSTGIDTFSRATFDDVLRKARQSKMPVYVVNLGELARRRLSAEPLGLLSRVDWAACDQQLERLAEASGGRKYSRAGTPDVDGIYDEIIEDLKVRYVLTYAPTLTSPSVRRTVQVAVADVPSREAKSAADTSRRHNEPRVIAEAAYTPANVAAPAAIADADHGK